MGTHENAGLLVGTQAHFGAAQTDDETLARVNHLHADPGTEAEFLEPLYVGRPAEQTIDVSELPNGKLVDRNHVVGGYHGSIQLSTQVPATVANEIQYHYRQL